MDELVKEFPAEIIQEKLSTEPDTKEPVKNAETVLVSVLNVKLGSQYFAIPQVNILKVVKQGPSSNAKIETINGEPVLTVQGSVLPVIDLKEYLHLPEQEKGGLGKNKPSFVLQAALSIQLPEGKKKNTLFPECAEKTFIICEVDEYRFGVVVDSVEDMEDNVAFKASLPPEEQAAPYAGYVTLNDGRVIPMLSPKTLFSGISNVLRGYIQETKEIHSDQDSDVHTSGFVLFKALDGTLQAASLEQVLRLEEINVARIEELHGRLAVEYRHQLMPLLKMDSDYKLPEKGKQPLLVFHNDNEMVGLLVADIIDIVKASMSENSTSYKDGSFGSIVVSDKRCDVVDISYYLAQSADKKQHKIVDDQEKKMKLLLVDDSPFFRKFIQEALEIDGFDVLTAESGAQAMQLIEAGQANDINAMITDIDMPQMSGRALLAKCREIPAFETMPIIALSAHFSGALESDEGQTQGFNGCILKTNYAGLIDLLQDV